MGHIERNCPNVKYQEKKGTKERYHAHVVKDDEHVQKKAREDCSSEKECLDFRSYRYSLMGVILGLLIVVLLSTSLVSKILSLT